MVETIVILLLVGLDQLVKYLVRVHIPLGQHIPLIPGLLGLSHIQNTGAAFSMLTGARWFFVVLTVAFVLFAMWVLLTKKITYPLGKWTLVMIIAGAVGNLIDRALFGYVVDMFETLFMNFPIFNVADIFVVVGGIGFCIYYGFLHDKVTGKTGKKQEAETPEEPHDDSL